MNISPEIDFGDIIRFTRIAKLPISWMLKLQNENETPRHKPLYDQQDTITTVE